ncbi:hypothetical protein FQZ97_839640 [compost metagenome]
MQPPQRRCIPRVWPRRRRPVSHLRPMSIAVAPDLKAARRQSHHPLALPGLSPARVAQQPTINNNKELNHDSLSECEACPAVRCRSPQPASPGPGGRFYRRHQRDFAGAQLLLQPRLLRHRRAQPAVQGRGVGPGFYPQRQIRLYPGHRRLRCRRHRPVGAQARQQHGSGQYRPVAGDR